MTQTVPGSKCRRLSPVFTRSHPRRNVRGYVHVPREHQLAYDTKVEVQPCRFVTMAAEGPGSVTEAEPCVCGYASDVGPVLATVGHESYPFVSCETGETSSKWEVGVHDENLPCASLRQRVDACCDRSVQTESRLFQQQSAVLDRPCGHIRVVADDCSDQRRCCGQNMLCHRTSEKSALRWPESRREPSLGSCKPLYRNERHTT